MLAEIQLCFYEKIKYKQFEGESRNWDLADVEFEKINLLVGKNSAGKSKHSFTLMVLVILGENAKLPFSNGCCMMLCLKIT